jgi:hypothetical protein
MLAQDVMFWVCCATMKEVREERTSGAKALKRLGFYGTAEAVALRL